MTLSADKDPVLEKYWQLHLAACQSRIKVRNSFLQKYFSNLELPIWRYQVQFKDAQELFDIKLGQALLSWISGCQSRNEIEKITLTLVRYKISLQ